MPTGAATPCRRRGSRSASGPENTQQERQYGKRRYKRRNRNEIMFGRIKNQRRAATRYDRCPKAFFSAVVLAATVIFWL